MLPTQRFSSRVDNYIRYRPGYPAAILGLLQAECGLNQKAGVADVGSGTGLLARLFLEFGCKVYGIEPNQEMRQAGERLLQDQPGFISLEGTAEKIPLPDHSVDFITVGQAFHWFDTRRARAEFQRIVQPQGWCILVWNDRRTDSPFLQDYERLLHRYGMDYKEVANKFLDEQVIKTFYGRQGCQKAVFPNQQVFDFAGLQGRLLSSSYAPEAGHPLHHKMLAALGEIFNQHQRDGLVTFDYQTQVYYGQFSPDEG